MIDLMRISQIKKLRRDLCRLMGHTWNNKPGPRQCTRCKTSRLKWILLDLVQKGMATLQDDPLIPREDSPEET